jgi:hypothetical protein
MPIPTRIRICILTHVLHMLENQKLLFYLNSQQCQFYVYCQRQRCDNFYCLQLAGQSVLVGRVDCDSHPSLGTRFHITKYPTLKYVQNGQLGKKEYRGQRSAQAFLEFVQEQIKNPVQEIRHAVATVLALFYEIEMPGITFVNLLFMSFISYLYEICLGIVS